MRGRKRRRRPPREPREGVVIGLDRHGTGWVDEPLVDGNTLATVDASTPGCRRVEVPDTLPGERVVYREIDRHRGVGKAELVELLSTSPDRVTPSCVHVGLCGGCSLQHLSAAGQLAHKQASLLRDLATIGGVVPNRVLPPVCGPSSGYRRRARLGIKDVPGKGKVLVGFRERDKRFVADLQQCMVLMPPADRLLEPLAACVADLSIRARTPQAEISVGDDAVALVLRVLDPPTDEDKARLRVFEREFNVCVLLQPGGPSSIEPLTAAPNLTYRLSAYEVEFRFESIDFVQVNGAINEQMVTLALELLDVQSHHRVLDLFCGLGNFSLPLARRAQHVVGLEGEASLVARARDNAAHNQVANVDFAAVDLYGPSIDAAALGGPYDRVLLDPPRSGAEQIVAVLPELGVSRVVYVACSPQTLARDAGELCRRGYTLEAAGVLDMFPHTGHVESIAAFQRTLA